MLLSLLSSLDNQQHSLLEFANTMWPKKITQKLLEPSNYVKDAIGSVLWEFKNPLLEWLGFLLHKGILKSLFNELRLFFIKCLYEVKIQPSGEFQNIHPDPVLPTTTFSC